jgi:hypothetical protein
MKEKERDKEMQRQIQMSNVKIQINRLNPNNLMICHLKIHLSFGFSHLDLT